MNYKERQQEIDLVRPRTEVFFGDKNPEDICRALWKLCNVFFIEAYVGHCKRIVLTKHNDRSLSAKSYDLGLELGSVDDTDNPSWEKAFCRLYADWSDDNGPFDFTQEELINGYLYDYDGGDFDPSAPIPDMCNPALVQFVSEFMDIEVNRDGKLKRLHFERGHSVRPLSEEPSNDPESYTLITFAFDPTVFATTDVPDDCIESTLRSYAFHIRGLRLEYINEVEKSHSVFCFNSASEFVTLVSGCDAPLVYENELTITHRERYDHPDYTAVARLTFALIENTSLCQSVHNYTELPQHGTHFTALTERICRILSLRFGGLTARDIEWEELSKHSVFILQTHCPKYRTRWATERQTAICNRLITEMCEELVNVSFLPFHDSLDDFISKNYTTLENTITSIFGRKGE